MSHLTCSLRRLAAAALLIATGVAAAESTWRDNFDQGQQLPWTSVRGNWIASDGTYAAQQPGSSPVTAALLPYDLSDFSIEVDLIQPVDGGLWLRANADATSGVLLVVFANRMYWHVIADPVTGPWTIHGFAWISPALGSGANRIRVTGHGPILRAYVNGAPVATSTLDLTTVTNPPGTDFLRGRVGLYDNAAPGTLFDNLRLEAGTPVEVVAVGDVGNPSVRFFPIDANGDVAPVASLSGANTGLADVRSVAFDSDHLYVASGSGQSIRAYPMGTLGNIPPVRTITGPNTTLGGVYGIDLSGAELYASSSSGPVSVFDASATGDVAPLRSIDAMTGAYAIEQDGDELFVARDFTDASSVYAFDRNASGAAAPLRHLAGTSTGLGCCNLGLAATPTELFVCQYYDSRILVWPRSADGDSAPVRTLGGSTTGLSLPLDIAVRDNEIFVANSAPQDVRVFPANANGDTTPTRIIGGPTTGLHTPFSLAFGIYMIPDEVFANGFE
jgi:hypothetical protein